MVQYTTYILSSSWFDILNALPNSQAWHFRYWNYVLYIQIRWYGMIANHRTIPNSSNEMFVSNYRQPCGFQQWRLDMLNSKKNANKNINNLIYNKMIYKKANMAYMTQRQSLNYRLRTWEEKNNVARLNMCVSTLPSPSLAQWCQKKFHCANLQEVTK